MEYPPLRFLFVQIRQNLTRTRRTRPTVTSIRWSNFTEFNPADASALGTLISRISNVLWMRLSGVEILQTFFGFSQINVQETCSGNFLDHGSQLSTSLRFYPSNIVFSSLVALTWFLQLSLNSASPSVVRIGFKKTKSHALQLILIKDINSWHVNMMEHNAQKSTDLRSINNKYVGIILW